MTYISFDDYTMPQLGQIMDSMLKERGYTDDADEAKRPLDEDARATSRPAPRKTSATAARGS